MLSLCFFVAWAWSPVADAQTPFDPGGLPGDRVSVSACGLVETIWADPDWILATSDRILRANLCLASEPCDETAWYDQVESPPCYPENRFFKFENDAMVANAFPMSALGQGTFDGLYIKPGVEVQLYQGSDDTNPYGPLQVGPRYVSIDYWQSLACDGFEPGTFFVTGDPGVLADYSIRFGLDVDITKVNIKEDINEKAHNTVGYKQNYVLRRGATFVVEVDLSKHYTDGCHEIYFEARHPFDGATTRIDVPAFETSVPSDQWGAHVTRVVTKADESKRATVEINIPATVPVGEYELTARTRQKGAVNAEDEEEFGEPIVVLFNPWSSDDDVHLADAAQRGEYVLRESGRIWRGSAASNAPKFWRYGQFDSDGVSLKVALDLLDGQDSGARSDPGLLARHLSAAVNSNGGGILQGKWQGPYSGGNHPLVWTGSVPILKEFDLSGGPVRYGQCWVFAGVLNTVLRALGIPARPVTNFESAHDEDGNKTIEHRFDLFGNLDGADSESIWNFHVWCEAWINGGWNVVDATPQELSGGQYRLGPAPVSAVFQDAGGLYDVDFVFAEVDADVRYLWMGFHVRTDTTRVGRNISTKAVGTNAQADITGNYKAAPKSTKVSLPSEVEVQFSPPAAVLAGTPLVWSVDLTNNSASTRQLHVVLSGSALEYRGDWIANLAERTDTTVSVPAGGTESVSLVVPEPSLTAWTATTRTFGVGLFVEVLGTSDLWVDSGQTRVVTADVEVTLEPPAVALGSTVAMAAEFSNPLSTSLTNVTAVVSVDDGLTVDGGSQATEVVGTVGPGGTITLSKELTVVSEGLHSVVVLIDSDELTEIMGEDAVVVGLFADGFESGDSSAWSWVDGE
ncbi:MAG: hypothetical protein GY856_42795 [bacterium]|nr:hypothetical protein [bacterium]